MSVFGVQFTYWPTKRSSTPSPSKSANAADVPQPEPTRPEPFVASRKCPLPSFTKRRMSSSPVITRSGAPSSFTSPTATPIPYSEIGRPASFVRSSKRIGPPGSVTFFQKESVGCWVALGSPGHQSPFTKRRSMRPSPSASNAATPEPIVSGIHFFPAAPFTCTNEMPEAFVTSSNRIEDATFVGSGAGVGETGFGGVFCAGGDEQTEGSRRRGDFFEWSWDRNAIAAAGPYSS